jgi:hypothetical protein
MSEISEIDSLRSDIINLQDQRDLAMKVIKRLEGERDEAREKYDALATEHMLAVNKLCNERDVLRIDSQKEAEHHDKMVGELENLYDKLTKSVELIKLLIKQVEYPAYTVDEVVEKMFLMDKAKRFIK